MEPSRWAGGCAPGYHKERRSLARTETFRVEDEALVNFDTSERPERDAETEDIIDAFFSGPERRKTKG